MNANSKHPDQPAEINSLIRIFMPHHTIVVGYYGFMLDVHVSVHLSVSRTSLCFSFLDVNLSKHQRIFTKLGMYIDIMEIWFGIANGQILSNFYRVICQQHDNGGVL